jgi:hypothetical protein
VEIRVGLEGFMKDVGGWIFLAEVLIVHDKVHHCHGVAAWPAWQASRVHRVRVSW